MSGILSKFEGLRRSYVELKAAGHDPFAICFDAVLSPHEAVWRGRRMILLGTNNYLGLTFDSDCIEAATQACRIMGTGTTGSRIANGTYCGHAELERRIARFFGRRAAMLFTTGYHANMGILSTIVGRDDHVVIDADSHASIYDGCRLGHAQVSRFRHSDPEDLARRLRRLAPSSGNRLVVVEGIYSMRGDVGPLREIAAVTRELGAYLLVDEAHSMGVLGHHGRGAAEQAGVEADVHFTVGTMSKSLGAIGGFCVSDLPDFDLLRVACRPYMFTASLPPGVVASTLAALLRLETDDGLRQTLWRNAERLHGCLHEAGFILGAAPGPIISLRMPSVELAIAVWNAMLEAGVYLNLALPPATPDHHALLRSSVSAALSTDLLDEAIDTILAVGHKFGLCEAKVAPLSAATRRGTGAIKSKARPKADDAAATPSVGGAALRAAQASPARSRHRR